jgi:tetratricopeptide (TPR) repeat protein
MAVGQQWEVLAQKLSRAANQLKPLEKGRDKGSTDAQAMLDTLGKRIADKHRAVVERAADCYYDAGEFKKALDIYTALYQEIPEDKRIAEKPLTTKLADVLDKTGDFKTALRLYDGLYKAASEKDRKTWATFDIRNRLAAIYFEKMNDYKTALEFYKGALETFEPERRESADTKWLRDKIAACEDKIKTTSGATPGGKAVPAKRAGS